MSAEPYEQASETAQKFPCWVGDKQDLARIVAVVTELAHDAVDKVLPAVGTDQQRVDFAKSFSDTEDDVIEERWQSAVDERREEISEVLTPTLMMKHRRFNRELKGNPANVLADTDVDDVIEARIFAGSIYGYEGGGYGIAVEFTRADGCQVRAKGLHANWVASVGGRLEEEISRQRPWYWWLRSWVAAGVLSVIAIVPIVIWAGYLATTLTGDSYLSSLIYGFGFGALFFAAWGGAVLVRQLLPAFELLESGAKARGARAIGAVVAVVAWIAALVIPLVMQGWSI